MKVCCDKFEFPPPLLTKEEWKPSGKFEAILNDTSKLTTICQNEEKLNGACGLVMRKVLHDGFSCRTMKVMSTNELSSNKLMMQTPSLLKEESV